MLVVGILTCHHWVHPPSLTSYRILFCVFSNTKSRVLTCSSRIYGFCISNGYFGFLMVGLAVWALVSPLLDGDSLFRCLIRELLFVYLSVSQPYPERFCFLWVYFCCCFLFFIVTSCVCWVYLMLLLGFISLYLFFVIVVDFSRPRVAQNIFISFVFLF